MYPEPNVRISIDDAAQRPPIRMFEEYNSYNKFVPIVYQKDVNPPYDFNTPSTICPFGSFDLSDANMGSDFCSLYGAPSNAADMVDTWTEPSAAGFVDSGADYYLGAPYEVASADFNVHDFGMMDWTLEHAFASDCTNSYQAHALSVKCGESDFCLESGKPCAMDLDCCQSEGEPMFCHPVWGYCVHTVECCLLCHLLQIL